MFATACGGNGAVSHPASAKKSTPTDVGALIAAQHPGCGRAGGFIARYLITGDTRGYPQIEQKFATTRSELLTRPKEARAGLARSQADDYITACDGVEAKKEADAQTARDEATQAAAAAQARAVDDAAATKAENARVALYASTCSAHAGHLLTSDNCLVSYPGWADQIVPMNKNGTFDQSSADLNQQSCGVDTSDAQIDAQDGHPWSNPPHYYPDSGVCVPGNP